MASSNLELMKSIINDCIKIQGSKSETAAVERLACHVEFIARFLEQKIKLEESQCQPATQS